MICRHASASQASSRRQHGGLAPRRLAELVQLVPADSSLSTSLTQHQQQRDQVGTTHTQNSLLSELLVS